MNEPPVIIDYTNYCGRRSKRGIFPIRIFFGKTDYHPDAQWYLHAWDFGKGATRDFAMADIHSWSTYKESTT